MTLAIDKATGKVVGQVVEIRQPPEQWTTTIKVLTRDGYAFVSDLAVRLEEVR